MNSISTVQPLNADDFLLSTDNKEIKIPPLLSPKLPQPLLAKFSIPQLKVEDIYIDRGNNSARQASRGSYVAKAKELKHLGEAKFNSKDYKLSVLCFAESLLLFVLDFYLNEQKLIQRSKGKPLKPREKEWISLVKYSLRIVDNFGPIEEELPVLRYIFGLCHYMNGFILKHLIEMRQQRLKDVIEKGMEEGGLVVMAEKLLKLRRTSRNSLRKGENQLSIFDVVSRFPGLFSRSKKHLSDVNLTDFIFPGEGEDGGVNYCLPIAEHTFSLMSMVNFGLFFLKDWAQAEGMEDWTI
ncbi:DEKNAAC101123 [Brettanomyces naardenensis]|uniref:DEKNAAC101123 n=1 Tax=Brettanomyces naardenensis TaxID=13370 RepID=A0A448YHI3_BRENA|nr:DEKNAAC101123 [Brettanomyces naardenensis]